MSSRLQGILRLATAAALGATLVGGVNAIGGTDAVGAQRTAGPEPANLGQDKLAVQDFYGDTEDAAGHHHASQGSAWDQQTTAEVAAAQAHLAKRLAEGVRNPAIVLDIDDTSELTYGWEADRDFGFDEAAQRDAIRHRAFEPIGPTRELARWAAEHGVKVYFLTGRGESLGPDSLRNLAAEGFPQPAGAFFKPERSAPDYLPCGLDCSTIEYKSGTRAHLEDHGEHIVLNLGDQHSDLAGGHAEKPVKLPNPMYYLP